MIQHPGLFEGFLIGVVAVAINGLSRRFRRHEFSISAFAAVLFSLAGGLKSLTYPNTGTPVCFEHVLLFLFVSLLGVLFAIDSLVCGSGRRFKVALAIGLLSFANVGIQVFAMTS